MILKNVNLRNVKVFESSEKNVWKYVYEFKNAIAESVLYKYDLFEKRTVICCSVQSGCPVGCTFCGTGKKFIRNLTSDEIIVQIKYVLEDKKIESLNIKKFQLMFMSMGEPFLNYDNVRDAIIKLNKVYPNAELLVSTIAPNNKIGLKDFITLSKQIDKIGLQFSIHKSNDNDRDLLIPFKAKLSLSEIRDYGVQWWKETGRKPYCNYCVDGNNSNEKDYENLKNLFLPSVFNFTFSVICSSDETMKNAGFRNLNKINKFKNLFLEQGFNVRVFNPAGQDDIGGGCGQLWYVQDYMKKYI